MKPIRVLVNFKLVRGPYGGANSFMKTLLSELGGRGIRFGNELKRGYDLALVNALSEGIQLPQIRRIREEFGLPILHRKVGYTVSGGPEMRKLVDGVPHGERVQMAFDPYVAHTIFQSDWSRREFELGGFQGSASVISNGVDTDCFSPFDRKGMLFWKTQRLRDEWKPGEDFRIAISSWSTDPNKGFADYARLDEELESHPGYEILFFGRLPQGLTFRNIRNRGALPHARLAAELRKCHAILTLSRNETCSNSLIEAMSCGLPTIYLDSGSSRELAENYGVEYRGDFWNAFADVERNYRSYYEKLLKQPFRIDRIADQYEKLIRSFASSKG